MVSNYTWHIWTSFVFLLNQYNKGKDIDGQNKKFMTGNNIIIQNEKKNRKKAELALWPPIQPPTC